MILLVLIKGISKISEESFATCKNLKSESEPRVTKMQEFRTSFGKGRKPQTPFKLSNK